MALRLARLSSSSFHERMARAKAQCGLSPLDRCFKRHPLQLALGEVRKIKDLFADTELVCWPTVSMYYEGLRTRDLLIGKSTFYKYVRLLGLKRIWRRAIPKAVGLRATLPNEYWHVDTTFWELILGAKVAIALVSDNFSKAILGYSVSLSKHAPNVVAALRGAIATMCEHHPDHPSTIVVADGGGENHLPSGRQAAISVAELIHRTPRPQIIKVVALQDVVFSNSAIEGINKILKQYLRYYNPRRSKPWSGWSAERQMIQDYGFKRPHGSLNGLIPMERYKDPTLRLDRREQIQQARAVRIEQNRQVNCGLCVVAAIKQG